MNILFLNTYQPTCNTSGGIARVTCNLGELFTANGNICGLAYYLPSQGKTQDCFVRQVQLTAHSELPLLKELAASYDTFIIQIQMTKDYLYLIPMFDEIKAQFGTKLIYCHHSVPFSEAAGYDFKYLEFLLFHSNQSFRQRIKESLWCLTAILFPGYSTRKIARRRQYVADHVDRIVLLSESFVPLFRKFVHCPDNKVVGIGNCHTFKEKLQPSELNAKEKTVLVVANMNEHAKRISTILRIWKKFPDKSTDSQWKLVLIGNGPDLDYYRRLAKHLKLKNCSFEGKQDPQPYYRKSSILLMTSAFEGFGMVILEAQQMGCVPMVYNSYESVHDLITDGQNGLLVENRNKKDFTDRLIRLMKDAKRRKELALNCIEKDNRFSNEVIFSLWKDLFDSLKQVN